MSDETPTHRRVMEKARAEIERLTVALHETTQERDAEADAVTAQREEIKRLTRELAEARIHRDDAQKTLTAISEVIGSWANVGLGLVEAVRAVVAERYSAQQERDALRAMMPSEDEAEGLRAFQTARFCGGPSEVYAKAALYLDRLSPLLTNSIDRTEEDRNV